MVACQLECYARGLTEILPEFSEATSLGSMNKIGMLSKHTWSNWWMSVDGRHNLKGRLYSKAKEKGTSALAKTRMECCHDGSKEVIRNPFGITSGAKGKNQGVSPFLKGNKLRSDPDTKAKANSSVRCSQSTNPTQETSTWRVPHTPTRLTTHHRSWPT